MSQLLCCIVVEGFGVNLKCLCVGGFCLCEGSVYGLVGGGRGVSSLWGMCPYGWSSLTVRFVIMGVFWEELIYI